MEYTIHLVDVLLVLLAGALLCYPAGVVWYWLDFELRSYIDREAKSQLDKRFMLWLAGATKAMTFSFLLLGIFVVFVSANTVLRWLFS